MSLTALRDDALSTAPDGIAVRVSLPWIRSLPLASLRDPTLVIDGSVVSPLLVAVGDRIIGASALRFERGWWFAQDRVVLRGRTRIAPGAHDVSVSFSLDIPYLEAGPHAPLRLPFSFTRSLEMDAAPSHPSVSQDVR